MRRIEFITPKRSPGGALIGTAGALCAIGFWHRPAFVLGSALAASAAFLWLHARSSAERIYLSRREASRPVEGEEAEIAIDVFNASASAVAGTIVEDQFGAGQSPPIAIAPPEPIRGRARMKLSYKAKCDSGMGVHRLGPIAATTRDPLGLFEFRTIDRDEFDELDVAPKIERIPELDVEGTRSSQRYGPYETAARGLSVNFVGVRPYSVGDSLRHVAWKPSAKLGELLVKEFERSAACEATVAVNLDPGLHVGDKTASSWETAKDAALAIVSQMAELGNSIELVLGDRTVERSVGAEAAAAAARAVAGVDFLDFENAPVAGAHPLRGCVGALGPGHALFYVAPWSPRDTRDAHPRLKALAEAGVRVWFALIDVSALWGALRDTEIGPALAALSDPDRLRSDVEQLRASGVDVILLSPGASMPEAFARALGRRIS